jgi:hypothetical protein
MTVKSVLFVSESQLERPREAEQLQQIVATARERNAALGVKSALLMARGHFAQLVEGPEEGVEALMASIVADPRHRHVEIVHRQDSEVPMLRGSPMDVVYTGESFYVARYITPLLDPAQAGDRPRLAMQLLYLLRELGKAHQG